MFDDQESSDQGVRGEVIEDLASPALLSCQMADLFTDRRLSDIFKDCDTLVQVLEAGEPGSISFVIRYAYTCFISLIPISIIIILAFFSPF